MSIKRNITIYLRDMITYMELARKFLKGVSYEEFRINKEKMFAVIHCIEIIGEATKHISKNIRKKFPEIPWRDIACMRDRLIHGYFDVNPKLVWIVVKRDIPKIEPLLNSILQQLEKEQTKENS